MNPSLPLMHTIRCRQCQRKLAQGQYIALAIKCPRCRTLNQFTFPIPFSFERHRTPVMPRRTDHERALPSENSR